ncbi:MAG: glycosyltransferase family 32 protein, partial [Limisphaerales bacterium]
MSNIPRKIFQFWHDKHSVPPDYAHAFACNRQMNPHFEFLLIDDTFVDTLLQEHFDELLLRLYRLNRVPASRCDMARLAALYHYGGVYLDASLKLHGRLDPVAAATGDTAFLMRDDMAKYQADPSQAHLWNGFIISRQGSPLIGRCLLEITQSLTSGQYNTDVLNATGPGVINRVAGKVADGTYVKLSFKE